MYTEETMPNVPGKKNWKDPELLIISRNNVLGSKTHPNVHEATGKTVTTNGYVYFSNQAGTSRVVLSKHSNPIGHKSSAAS